MTRSRLMILTSFGIVALGLAVATGVSLSGSARAAVGPMPPEALALPADSTFVAGIDVHRLVASPFYRKYSTAAKGARPEAMKELQEKFGFNPEQDVDQVVVAGKSGGDSGAALVFGRFDRTRLQQAIESQGKGDVTWKNHEGATVYLFGETRKHPGAFAFLGDGLMVTGSQAAVESVLTNHSKGGKGLSANAALIGLLGSVKSGSTFWAVGDASALRHLPSSVPAPGPGAPPSAAAQGDNVLGPAGAQAINLPPMKSVVVTGDLDPLVSIQATGEAADEAAAKNLADVVRGFLALAQLQAGQRPELKELSSAVSVAQDAKKVIVSARLPYELIESLQPKKIAATVAAPAR